MPSLLEKALLKLQSRKGVKSAASASPPPGPNLSRPTSPSQQSPQSLSHLHTSQRSLSDPPPYPGVSQTLPPDPSWSVQSTQLASQSTFEVALQQRLQKILTPSELESFRIAQQNISVDELLSKVKSLDNAYNQTSTSRRYAKPLTEVFQIMHQFMSGVAIGIQASPEISSLVVGGVRIVIDVAVKFVEFFNKLTRMISELGDYSETFAQYADVASNIAHVQNALLNAYEDVLRFCKDARTVFINDDGSVKEWATTKSFFRAQWQPFEARFGEIEKSFKHHLEVLLLSIQPTQLKGIQELQLSLKSLMSSTAGQTNETKTYYEVPSLRVSQFVERPDLLKEIENSFVNNKESAPRPRRTVLLGMGGQGKTQLALEYCRLSRILETYQAIFWIDAFSSKTVSRAFETIAAKISHPGRLFDDIESKVAFVKGTFEGWQMPWLMVFDNYDNVDEFKNISDYLPEGRTGTILFTSRHAGSERLGSVIRLTQMTEDGSLELLLRQSKCERTDKNNIEGIKIVKRLGYLPLAIDQAGVYISQRKLPLSHFIKHYEDRKEYVLKHTPSLWEYRRKIDGGKEETLSVFTTWELSFQQIHQSDKDRIFIGHFLTLSAFLNASDVGEDIFKFSPTQENEDLDDKGSENEHAKSEHSKWMELFTTNGDWDQYKYEDIIAELSSLSLIQRIATESTVLHFSLHPLVADWLRLRTEQKRRKDFMIEGTTILANYIKKQDQDGLSLEVKQYLLAHIDACLCNNQEYLTDIDRSDIESLRNSAVTFASYYTSLDRYIEAEALYKLSLKGYEKALGPEHTLTLDTVHSLGILYMQQGNLAEAEALYKRALKGKEKALGPEHTSTLKTVHNLGYTYNDQGKLAEAEALYLQALVGFEKVLGPEHKLTLMTVNNLGNLYRDQGKLAEAEAWYLRALAGYKKVLGPEHTSTLYTVANLGLLYCDQGKLAEAEAWYQRALEGFEKALGPEHTSTLETVNNIGSLYYKQGKLAEAEAWHLRALEGFEKALGPKHTSTLNTVHNLGMLYSDQEKPAEAEAWYLRAIAGYEKALGPEHKSTLNTVNSLGNLYFDQGKLAEAEALYQRALVGNEKALGPKHMSTLNTVYNLGSLYRKQGKLAKAKAWYQQALAGYEKALGPEHTSTLNTVHNLGMLYSDQEKPAEAEAWYLRAIAGYEKALGPEHTSTLNTVNNLGMLYSDQGKLAEAEAWYQRALAGKEKALGPEHTLTLDTVYREAG